MLEVYILTKDRIVVQHPLMPTRHYDFTRWWTMNRFRQVLGVSHQVVMNWKRRNKIDVAEIIFEEIGVKVNLVDTEMLAFIDDKYKILVKNEIERCCLVAKQSRIEPQSFKQNILLQV